MVDPNTYRPYEDQQGEGSGTQAERRMIPVTFMHSFSVSLQLASSRLLELGALDAIDGFFISRP
jgi:hypothetical protein